MHRSSTYSYILIILFLSLNKQSPIYTNIVTFGNRSPESNLMVIRKDVTFILLGMTFRVDNTKYLQANMRFMKYVPHLSFSTAQ